MGSKELSTLYQLHLVDAAIADIRRRAASLDPGKELKQQLEILKKDWETQKKDHIQFKQELKELEDKQHHLSERLKKIDQEMYKPGVSAKDIEILQKEIQSIKTQQKENDSRMLELWEIIPKASLNETEAHQAAARIQKKLLEHQQKILAEKEHLEKEFKEKMHIRPQLALRVESELLKQYDAIKEKAGGIGMAIVKPDGSCSACGMGLSVRAIEYVNMDKIITCESCGRILFKVVPD
jgi:predicted  nucleic acid-binding Zn-ribbon protein